MAGIEPMQEKGEGWSSVAGQAARAESEPGRDQLRRAFVEVEVQDKTFATGVPNVGGTVPAPAEAVVEVPVTVSMLRMVRQVIGMKVAAQADQIRYSMSGKLGSHRSAPAANSR